MHPELQVQNLDHLGLIAGLVDELEIVEQINQVLGEDPREQISAGLVVKAMILNGLGFVSSPLYLFEQFFRGKATEHLLGVGVLPESLNDDRLGRVLDRLYLYGLGPIFLSICLLAAQKFGIRRKSAHLDATSMSVSGAYANAEEPLASSTGMVPIQIVHGYSRDHRPDLKQFVLNLVCWDDGDIPAYLELADGNQSDKARFGTLMSEFKKQWNFDGLYVADSALYSEDNLKQLVGVRWLTRVPLTVKAASELVEILPEEALQSSAQAAGYRMASVCSSYGGIAQRWIVVESQERQKSDLKQLEKTLAKATKQAEVKLRQLFAQAFACETDALKALNQLKLPWHQLEAPTVTQTGHYDKPGKPKAGTEPDRISYHPTATLKLKSDLVERHQRRAGRFILATNDLDAERLTTDQVLQEYKEQQGCERGFRFLKDPLFFASSIFLKSPERIMAMAMIMGLCLLVYNLGQRQLRQTLEQTKQTIPNQLKKETKTPTLRWVFQCFMAIHYVRVNGIPQILNLSDVQRRILQCFGTSCRQYYMLC